MWTHACVLLVILLGLCAESRAQRLVDLEMPVNHGGLRDGDYSPNGRLIAAGTGTVSSTGGGKSGGRGGELFVWDAKRGSILHNFGPQGKDVDFVRFSGDGKSILAGPTFLTDSKEMTGGFIRRWDLKRKRVVSELRLDSRPKFPAAVSPDGKTLVWVKKPAKRGAASDLVVWDMSKKKAKQRWSQQGSSVGGVNVTPDGKWVLVTSRSEAGKVATVAALTVGDGSTAWQQTFEGEDASYRSGRVFVAASSKNFAIVVAGGARVGVFKIADGMKVAEHRFKSDKSYRRVALSAKGDRLARVELMGEQLQVWNLKTGDNLFDMNVEFPKRFEILGFSPKLDQAAGTIPYKGLKGQFIDPPGIMKLK